MAIRYITAESNNSQPIQPAAPAPQQRTAAPVVNGYELVSRKAALQAELDAVQSAEQKRLNAEAESARKQALLRQELADIERAERESTVDTLITEGQRITASSANTVQKLYSELDTVVTALEGITADVHINGSFTRFLEVAQQAIAHAMPADFNPQHARATGGAVLTQLGNPPTALLPAMKAWIASTTNPQQRQIRAGITLALCGVVIRDMDITPGYSAERETAEIVRAMTRPE